MIRPTLPEDTPALLALTEETRVFRPMEIQALREVLDDYHASLSAEGHRSITCEQGGKIVGFAYYAPASMTDRTWYLYWIAVDKRLHGGGVGSTLLREVEADVLERRGRMLLVETSSMPHYAPTRSFYLKHGYHQSAVLDGYYADGDDMVIFRKMMAREAE